METSEPRHSGPRQFPPVAQTPPKRGCSCLLWGCLGCGGLMLFCLLSMAIMLYLFGQQFLGLVLSTQPLSEASTPVAAADRLSLGTKIQELLLTQSPDNEPLLLELTEGEFNALLAQGDTPDYSFRITFTAEDRMQLAASQKLDVAKYLNIRATGMVRILAQRVLLDVERLSLGGFKVPGMVATQLAAEVETRLRTSTDPQLQLLPHLVQEMDLRQQRLHLKIHPALLRELFESHPHWRQFVEQELGAPAEVFSTPGY